jgi:hypothetical protein
MKAEVVLRSFSRYHLLFGSDAIDDDWTACFPIIFDADVELFIDVKLFNNVHASTEKPLFACLWAHKYLPAHVLGHLLNFLWRADGVYTALEAVVLEDPIDSSTRLDLCR